MQFRCTCQIIMVRLRLSKNAERSFAFVFVLQLLFGHILSDPEKEKLRKYSTKTTYENSVFQDILNYGNNLSPSELVVEGCSSVAVSGLFRHGIRYPGEKDITNIAKVVFKLKVAGVVSSKVDALEGVANRFLMAEAKDLAESGRKELRQLGNRFGRRLRSFFPEMTPGELKFYTSSKSRAVDSCDSFKGGFGVAAGITDIQNITNVIDDRALRFFDDCNKYVTAVADNNSAIAESTKFQVQFLPKMNVRIAQRLGVENLELTKGELNSVLVVAATEFAIFGSSVWSQLLSDEDLELLEYASDIKNYWKKGYGYPINYEPSCVLLRHMFQHFDDIINGKGKQRAAFYFGHTETVIPVLSILGLFRDGEPLMAQNYGHHTQRLFCTTRLSPFASNIAFVLHNCSAVTDSDEGTGSDQFSLELLFKERPLEWPACGQTTCPYSTVRNYYSKYLDVCNFTEMCSVVSHNEL